jgi:hypothetical protein
MRGQEHMKALESSLHKSTRKVAIEAFLRVKRHEQIVRGYLVARGGPLRASRPGHDIERFRESF